MKTKHILAVAAIVAGCGTSLACTNLLVGKNASADGAAMITYAADAHTIYGDLQYLPSTTGTPACITGRFPRWPTPMPWWET